LGHWFEQYKGVQIAITMKLWTEAPSFYQYKLS